jgi:hypothetical protein
MKHRKLKRAPRWAPRDQPQTSATTDSAARRVQRLNSESAEKLESSNENLSEARRLLSARPEDYEKSLGRQTEINAAEKIADSF